MMQAIRGVTFAIFIGFDWRRTVLQTVFVKDIFIVILSVLALIFHLRIELASPTFCHNSAAIYCFAEQHLNKITETFKVFLYCTFGM